MFKITMVAAAAIATCAAGASFAGGAMQSQRQGAFGLGEAVDLVANTYPGRPIAAQADYVGGTARHYHVDQLLPNGRIARFDVDAQTQTIANRISPEDAPESVPSLAHALKGVQGRLWGDVVSAEFDPDPKPHYHLNMQHPGGQLDRLQLMLDTNTVEPRRDR